MCAHFRPAPPQALSRFSGRPENVRLIYPEEVWPGNGAPILINRDGGHWELGAFGLVPSWAEPALMHSTYNARSETVADKPSFRQAWTRLQLCIIPARSIFESCYESGRAVPWQIERHDGTPFGIAGLWEHRPDDAGLTRWSFTMLTISAEDHPIMARFHRPDEEKRSIVILPEAAYADWLGARSEDAARALLQPFNPTPMQARSTNTQASLF